MREGLAEQLRERLRRSRRFFAHDIWEQRLDELPKGRAFWYRSARIVYCTWRGLVFEETLHVRAAALTYFTVLSIVPLLAFAFALLKGFGAYDALVRETIRPYVLTLLAQNAALRQAFDQVLGFVDRTSVASLGFLGLLLLLYAATRLLRNIEGALNEIWGARAARDILEQLRDYVAIIVVTPLSLLAVFAFTAVEQVLSILRSAGSTLGLGELLDRVIAFSGPVAVLFVGLLFLYTVLPNAPVKVRSATVGAVIGSVAWYLVLIAHVRFQVGVASYNALYSSFAAIPIFLAWQHISWLVVLVGAKVAATHQHHRSVARRARLAHADQAFKEALCLAALVEVMRAFVSGTARPTRAELSLKLDAPEDLIAQMLGRLIARGMLVETSAPEPSAYALGKAPELMRVKDVLDALRRSPDTDLEEPRGIDATVARVWLELDRAQERSGANVSLRELLDRVEGEGSLTDAGARARQGHRPDGAEHPPH